MTKEQALKTFLSYTEPGQVNVKVWLKLIGGMDGFLRFGSLSKTASARLLPKLQATAKEVHGGQLPGPSE